MDSGLPPTPFGVPQLDRLLIWVKVSDRQSRQLLRSLRASKEMEP